MNPIVATYSHLAREYDSHENRRSCWGIAAGQALASIQLKDRYNTVVEVGCGTGRALAHLASTSRQQRQFIGLEPAFNMRELAVAVTRELPCVRILDGAFEDIPIESETIDYLYSILAFHWTTDLDRSVNELRRILKKDGEMDLFFIGRYNGQEFIRKTTPIFLKYMGPKLLLQSAAMRKQLTQEAALCLFQKKFGDRDLKVQESYETYYDTLENHWKWWIRIEGHFVRIPTEKRLTCDQEIKEALTALETETGIPYTIHLLHVTVRST